jgi:hypothetical protein
VFLQQDGAKFAEPGRAVREHRKDAATFGNQQREQLDVRVASMLKPCGDGVAAGGAEMSGELQNKPVGHRHSCKQHLSNVHLPGVPRKWLKGKMSERVGQPQLRSTPISTHPWPNM